MAPMIADWHPGARQERSVAAPVTERRRSPSAAAPKAMASELFKLSRVRECCGRGPSALRFHELFGPPDELRLFGRTKRHVVFGVVEQLIAGEFQVGGDRGRSLMETEFCRVSVVRRPRAGEGDGLTGQRAVGQASLLPRALATRQPIVCAVHAHEKARRGGRAWL